MRKNTTYARAVDSAPIAPIAAIAAGPGAGSRQGMSTASASGRSTRADAVTWPPREHARGGVRRSGQQRGKLGDEMAGEAAQQLRPDHRRDANDTDQRAGEAALVELFLHGEQMGDDDSEHGSRRVED